MSEDILKTGLWRRTFLFIQTAPILNLKITPFSRSILNKLFSEIHDFSKLTRRCNNDNKSCSRKQRSAQSQTSLNAMATHERCGWLSCQGYEQKHYRQGLQTFDDCKSLSCLRKSCHCLAPLVGVCWCSGAVKAWSPSQTSLQFSTGTHLKEFLGTGLYFELHILLADVADISKWT